MFFSGAAQALTDRIAGMTIRSTSIKTIFLSWGVVTAALVGFLYGTNPDDAGPVGVTAFFLVAYVFIALSLQLAVLAYLRVLASPGSRLEGWKFQYALILAFLPVTVVGLGTLDQLVLRDVILFGGLITLVLFYAVTSSKK